MTQKPEALRLAEIIETAAKVFGGPASNIASELRRLSQSEREGWRYADELEQESKRLHDLNQGLLRALSWIDQRCPVEFLKQQPHRVHWEAAHDAGACARAAIAKATGEAA